MGPCPCAVVPEKLMPAPQLGANGRLRSAGLQRHAAAENPPLCVSYAPFAAPLYSSSSASRLMCKLHSSYKLCSHLPLSQSQCVQ